MTDSFPQNVCNDQAGLSKLRLFQRINKRKTLKISASTYLLET